MGKTSNKNKKTPVPEAEEIHGKQIDDGGVAEKSKKIKKKKHGKAILAENTVKVIEAAGEPEPAKKSKKKHAKVPKNENTEELENKEMSVNPAPESDTPSKSKKHKKKKESVAAVSEVTDTQPTEQRKSKKQHKKDKTKVSGEGTEPEEAKSSSKKDKKKRAAAEADNPPKKSAKKQKHLVADQDVETSESESEGEEEQQESKEGSTVEKPTGDKKSKRLKGPEYSVFVGNLPTTVKKSNMKALFKQYGEILTIRFRTSDGVSLFKKKDRREAKALICYVRFATKEAAQAACAASGQTVEQNRIRVLLQNQKHMGHIASTVFVGNIHRKTTDNELYDFFNPVGEIEYVRQIADKGIGYVCFKKGVPIAKALKLNQQLLNGRPLRISKVDPKLQNQRRNKKGNLVNKHRPSAGTPAKSGEGQSNGKAPPKGTSFSKPAAGNSGEGFRGAAANKKNDKRHKRPKKGNSEYQKKVLARKLTAAAGGGRK